MRAASSQPSDIPTAAADAKGELDTSSGTPQGAKGLVSQLGEVSEPSIRYPQQGADVHGCTEWQLPARCSIVRQQLKANRRTKSGLLIR
jgi:hypothetical protein